MYACNTGDGKGRIRRIPSAVKKGPQIVVEPTTKLQRDSHNLAVKDML